MTLSWLMTPLGAGLLLLVGLLYLPIQRLRQYQWRQDGRLLQLNRQVYKQRLAELEQQHSAGELDARQLHEMQLELQGNLLSDMDGVEQGKHKADKLWPIVAITTAALVVVLAVYFSSGRIQQYQTWQQQAKQLPELRRMLSDPEQQMTAAELGSLALAIRTQLAEAPNNAADWMLLGQITSYLGQISQGIQAYEKALAITPDNPELKRFYGMTLAATGDPNDAQRAAAILRQLAAENPDDMDLANGIAFAFVEMGRKVEAAMIWQDLAERLPEDSPRRASILKIVAQLMGETPTAHAVNSATEATQTQQAQPEATGYQLSVHLSLAPALVEQLPSQGFLFLFAQASNGSKAPLAVKRLAIPNFPLTLTLSEADAMMQGWSLASVEEFELIARISRDNQGTVQAGELEGRSGVLKKVGIGAEIRLEISEMIKE